MSDTPRPRLLTCPRCKESYLGGPHEQLPDCPHCGYDYRNREGFRFDLGRIPVAHVQLQERGGGVVTVPDGPGGPTGEAPGSVARRSRSTRWRRRFESW